MTMTIMDKLLLFGIGVLLGVCTARVLDHLLQWGR
jgi:hypothetical protein